jgi:hypothetical protein
MINYLNSSGAMNSLKGNVLGFSQHSEKIGVPIAEAHSKEVSRDRYCQEESSWLHSTALKRRVMDLSVVNEDF